MSVFQRATVRLNKLNKFSFSHHLRRTVITNPAINNNPAYNFKAILPFDFAVEKDLRSLMLESGLESQVLFFEREYSDQLSNDAEFNHWVIPRSDESRLWGFIYGERLVKAQLELNNLSVENEFVGNYLKAQISELRMKIDRYYPDLDWSAQVNAIEQRTARDNNNTAAQADLRCAFNEILCQEFTNKSQIVNYLSSFSNNNFVSAFRDADANANADTDEFGDFLPSTLEDKMLNYFEFHWYLNCENVNAARYFPEIHQIEQSFSVAINALSKHLRNNLGLFFLSSIAANNEIKGNAGVDAQYVVDIFKRACPSLLSDNSQLTDVMLVRESLLMLDGSLNSANSTLSKAMSKLVSQLFLGNNNNSTELANQNLETVIQTLASADRQRLLLIHETLQIQECVKHESISSLLIAALLNEYPEWFAKLIANNNVSRLNENSSIIDLVVSELTQFYSAQEIFASKMKKLAIALNEIVACDSSSQYFSSFGNGNANATKSRTNLIPALFASAADARKESGDFLGYLKFQTYNNYLSKFGDKDVSWYKLFNFVLNPARNGFSSEILGNTAFECVNNTSQLTDTMIACVLDILRQQASVSVTSENSSATRSEILSTISNVFEEFKSSAIEYESCRLLFEDAFKQLRFDFDDQFDFEHVRETYDPLNIHLSQFRYLSPQ